MSGSTDRRGSAKIGTVWPYLVRAGDGARGVIGLPLGLDAGKLGQLLRVGEIQSGNALGRDFLAGHVLGVVGIGLRRAGVVHRQRVPRTVI